MTRYDTEALREALDRAHEAETEAAALRAMVVVEQARCAELEAECAHLAAYVAEARRQLAIARALLDRHGVTPGPSLN